MIPALPNTVAHELSRARELLEKAGWEIAQVDETRPPGKFPQPDGPIRVVQQRSVVPKRVVLLIARQANLER